MIAQMTGITTVADFRVADIAVQGQGAPLTSTFDYMILRPQQPQKEAQRKWRAVQNIGGIGNVTLIPPLPIASTARAAALGVYVDDVPPIAFDTGPGNVFIDFAAEACDSSLTYDCDGKLGAQGTCNQILLKEMMGQEYIKRGFGL